MKKGRWRKLIDMDAIGRVSLVALIFVPVALVTPVKFWTGWPGFPLCSGQGRWVTSASLVSTIVMLLPKKGI